MEPKVKNLDYTQCVSHVTFDQIKKKVLVDKSYYGTFSDGTTVRIEHHEFDLCTMPLSVALQMACGIVQQVGLVEYEEAN